LIARPLVKPGVRGMGNRLLHHGGIDRHTLDAVVVDGTGLLPSLDRLGQQRLCCTNPVRDSSRESSVVAGWHEQTYTPRLQDPELARLQRSCRVVLKSETARAGGYSLPLNVRFCFRKQRASQVLFHYLINCGK
jgi:hypothetical protein